MGMGKANHLRRANVVYWLPKMVIAIYSDKENSSTVVLRSWKLLRRLRQLMRSCVDLYCAFDVPYSTYYKPTGDLPYVSSEQGGLIIRTELIYEYTIYASYTYTV